MNTILLTTSCIILLTTILPTQLHLSHATPPPSNTIGDKDANTQSQQQQQQQQHQQKQPQKAQQTEEIHHHKTDFKQQRQQVNDDSLQSSGPHTQTTPSFPSTRSKRELSGGFFIVDADTGDIDEVDESDGLDIGGAEPYSVFGSDIVGDESDLSDLNGRAEADSYGNVYDIPSGSLDLLAGKELQTDSFPNLDTRNNVEFADEEIGANDVSKRAREFFGKRLQGPVDKRAREFFGKRAREFFGKRAREFFGKRAREFFGKRSQGLVDKRAREFFGKRSLELTDKRSNEDRLNKIKDNLLRNVVLPEKIQNTIQDENVNKRAREFFGKRAREFFGKRAGDDLISKRHREFFGKRSGDDLMSKRAREFFGKRSGDDIISKRHREFFGKRSGDDLMSKRAREFFGKRSGDDLISKRHREFFGKRSGDDFISKRHREFFGKRSDNEMLSKRAREFFGKRSPDDLISKRHREFFGKRSGEEMISKRAREFFGKRAREFFGKRSGFELNKRAREFFGKRNDQFAFDDGFGNRNGGLDYMPSSTESNENLFSLAAPGIENSNIGTSIYSPSFEMGGIGQQEGFGFLGEKRSREFFGKRSNFDTGNASVAKRAREFFGKRSGLSENEFDDYIGAESLDQTMAME